MSINYAKPSYGHASEYQVSGTPYLTGSTSGQLNTSNPVRVTFPYVTRWVQVTNIDANNPLWFGVTENGVKATETAHRIYVPANTMSPRLEMKTRDLFFLAVANTSGFTVAAGLTFAENMPLLSGSEGYEGVG